MAKRLNDYYLHEKEEHEQQEITRTAPKEDNFITIREQGESRGAHVWTLLRPVVIFVVSLLVVIGGINYVVNYVKHNYFDPANTADTTEKEITIKKGASLSSISKQLEEEGIIRNKQVFKLYVDFSDNASKLKAGTYTLSPDMQFDDIIYSLRQGRNSDPTGKVTLLEGLTVEDFSTTLVENEILANTADYLEKSRTGDDLTITSSELKEIVQNNKTASEQRKYALEGYIFPDTYEFFKDSDATTVLNKQLARFYEVFSSADYSRAMEMEMSVDEVVTLASIIEKEAQEHDFKKVSAVLHNRLNQEIPLQCDSTMAYALGIENRIVLTDSELERNRGEQGAISPYNTDQRIGLPIGPICNPSKAAIEAALYPDEAFMEEDYLYFVLTDPSPDKDGKLYLEFNKDLEAHNEAVAKYKPMWSAYDSKKAREANAQG